MKNIRKVLLSGVGVACLMLPATSGASVRITEIMYDAEGGDAGREWIEIANFGADAAELKGYTLAQDVNHKLVFPQGMSLLPPGGVAVISQNPAKFAADYPLTAAMVIKSAISLRNYGDTLTLKNASGTPLDTVAYTLAMGAAGDGNTLRLQGSVFAPGPAAPGNYPDPPKLSNPPRAAPAQASAAQAGVKVSVYEQKADEPETQAPPASSMRGVTPAQTAALALPAAGMSATMLLSLMALAALIVIGVTVALIAQSGMFRPVPQEVAAESADDGGQKFEALGRSPMGEADEYDIVESPNKFL